MRILAIDGGGIRGIYPAYILQRIQEEFDIKYSQYFDLIVGTSTGSIIAAALATDYPITDIVGLYEKRGKKIFKRKLLGWDGIFASRYSSKSIRKELVHAFGEKTLSDTKTRLIIPTTDIGNGCVHVVKSNYDPTFVRDPKRKIVDAQQDSVTRNFRITAVDGKNYNTKHYHLAANEMAQLQRLVSAYLDIAEDMALRQLPMTMQDWETRLNRFIEATDREILQDAGKITSEIAKAHAESEFEKYRIVQDRLFESDFDRMIKGLEQKADK